MCSRKGPSPTHRHPLRRPSAPRGGVSPGDPPQPGPSQSVPAPPAPESRGADRTHATRLKLVPRPPFTSFLKPISRLALDSSPTPELLRLVSPDRARQTRLNTRRPKPLTPRRSHSASGGSGQVFLPPALSFPELPRCSSPRPVGPQVLGIT